MTLSEMLEVWIETYIRPKRAKKTIDAYRYALAHLSAAAGATQIADLSPLQLQKEINRLAGHFSRQAQLMYIALRAALGKAVRLGLIERSPMDLCEPPAHRPRAIDYLTPAEASAYLEAAREDPRGALLILMLCIGLRRNEARGLRRGDLDAEGVLHIRRQRSGRDAAQLKSKASCRDIPLPEALRPFFDGPAGEYLVDCSETALRRSHLAVLGKCGIDRAVTLHGLRHTCATLAIQGGDQLTTVQRLLGHAHYSITADTYIHTDRRLLMMATTNIINLLSPPSNGVGARLEIV